MAMFQVSLLLLCLLTACRALEFQPQRRRHPQDGRFEGPPKLILAQLDLQASLLTTFAAVRGTPTRQCERMSAGFSPVTWGANP